MNINTKIITIKSVKNINNNSNKKNIINENLYYIEREFFIKINQVMYILKIKMKIIIY